MSLLSSLYTGVSGLQTYGDSLQVIGDNIANVNTAGFKSSRAEFADLLSQTVAGGGTTSQLGRGVALQGITANFSQGDFTTTNRMTDLAIEGNGFFVVTNDEANFYTRNGQFGINNEGDVVAGNGMRLLGYEFDDNGFLVRDLTTIRLGQGNNPARPTAALDVHLNLKSNIPAAEIFTFDPADPASTSNYSTTMSVYDSQGTAHTLTVYFNKLATPANSWEWHAMVDGASVQGGTPGVPFEGAFGTLTFSESGRLQAETTDAASAMFNFQGTVQNIAFDFGDAIGDGGTGLDGSTQFDRNSQIYSQIQDGHAAGTLLGININSDGIVSGDYSNGQSVDIAQIPLANFTNLQGLTKRGAGIYSDTVASGQPVIDLPNVGGLGSVTSFSLELSNVDLATEFVNLISNQRAYQANSKVITVGDQLMAEVNNLIR